MTSTLESYLRERCLYRVKQLETLSLTEKRLTRSCRQIILLNNKISGLTRRYQRARAAGNKGFRYNLRLRIATVEGARNMFYEYARQKAEAVKDLRRELFNENVVIVNGSGRRLNNDSDEDYDDDDDDEDDDDDDEVDYDEEDFNQHSDVIV